jgi:Flp pilus assembly protein TadG
VKIRPSVSLRTEKGTSLVEAALITPLLLLLTFAIVDFASLFYIYLALENGVSQASRYGVTGNQVAGMTREQSIRTAMRQATPTLTIADGAFSFSHLRPGQGTWDAGVGGPSDIDKVTVNYNWPLLTPLVRPFFANGQINLVVESAMKNEARFN